MYRTGGHGALDLWFNVKPFSQGSLTLNLLADDSLMLNHLPNCTKISIQSHNHPGRPDLRHEVHPSP
jgi:hypothetical protein